MIAEQTPCLDLDTLRDMLAGQLPTDRFAAALEHVERCEVCSQKAEAQSSTAQIDWIAGATESGSDRFDHESECQIAVGNLLSESPNIPPTQPETLGPYRLLGALGEGGMGAVHLAKHERLQRNVAIKILPREKLVRAGWLDRFNREMTSVASLEHPHVVRALDAGNVEDCHFLVMEYLDGLDLGEVCHRVPHISLSAACEAIRQAALGLQAIHDAGLVHRDIKPSNLFLTRKGDVKILDLGLVLDGESPLAADERLTTVGHLMGTLPYMAREQLDDSRNVSPQTDIYSLGATLFRILCGRPPYGKSDNLARMIQAIHTTECPSLMDLRSDTPPELGSFVDRMLSSEPEERPASAEEVAEFLGTYADTKSARPLIKSAVATPGTSHRSTYLENNAAQPASTSSSNRYGILGWSIGIVTMSAAAFLLGIMLTVATDKGTLTIQSDVPGASVTVRQGDREIDALQIDQSDPSKIRLRSGKYEIEVTGVDPDQLQISDEEIFLLRGEEKLVTISRKVPESDNTAPPLAEESSVSELLRKGLSYQPLQPDAIVTYVSVDELSECSITELQDPNERGFLITDAMGKPIRHFLDTNIDNKIDQWRYFHQGVETYRESDTNLDGRADEFVWFDRGSELRRGLDVDADGIIDEWKGTAKLFQGKPLSHWMQVLVRDQDNATLSNAMQAVASLAETPAERLSAAQQFLLPARRLGGVVLGSPPGTFSGQTNMSQSDLSGWFMSDLLNWYSVFLPKEGLDAIVIELKEGNLRSTQACLMLLNNSVYTTNDGILRSFQLDVLVDDDDDDHARESLRTLDSLLSKRLLEIESRIERLKGPPSIEAANLNTSLGLGGSLRARMLSALGTDATDDRQLQSWAKRKLNAAQAMIDSGQVHQGFGPGAYEFDVNMAPSPLTASTASSIDSILNAGDYDRTPIILGLLQPTFDSNNVRTLEKFDSLRKANPEKVATTVSLLFERTHAFGKNLGSAAWSGGGSSAWNQPEQEVTPLVATAIDCLVTMHPDPIEAIQPMVRCMLIKQLPPGFHKEAVSNAVDRLLVRLVLETDADEDSAAKAKMTYAALAFAHREIPEENADQVLATFVKQLRDFSRPARHIEPPSEWPFEEAGEFDPSSKDNLWQQMNFAVLLKNVFALYPASTIRAITTELREGNELSAYLCAELMQSQVPQLLNLLTEDKYALLEKHVDESEIPQAWLAYLESPDARNDIYELGQALDVAIGRSFPGRGGDTDDLPFDSYVFVGHRLIIAQFLGESLTETSVLTDALKHISTHSDSEKFPSWFLLPLSRTSGVRSIPLGKLMKSAINDWDSGHRLGFDKVRHERLRSLVHEIHESDPEKFRDFLLNELGLLVEFGPDYVNQTLDRPNFRRPCLLSSIIAELRSDPESTERLNEIGRELLEAQFPSSRTTLLKLFGEK